MRSLFIACAALLALLATSAAPAANLSEVYALARANDAQFAAALHAAAAGREKLIQGRALLLPTLSLTGNARRNHDRFSTAVADTPYSSSLLNLRANQPLWRPANIAARAQGELQARLADQQLALAEQDLLLRVSRGYFEVLQARDAFATLSAQKEAFAQQLAQARRSHEVGLAPVTDVAEAQSRYDLTRAQEIAARNELEVKRRVLEKAINNALPPLAGLDAAADVALVTPAQLEAMAEAAALGALPVAMGQTNVAIARREVEKQEAGHGPTLDLVGELAENRNANIATLGRQKTRPAYLGVELALPLYQGGATSSRVREAVANLGRAESELEEARRQAVLDARQALLGVQSGVALTQALLEAVASGETQLRSTRRGLEVGVRTRVDVLNAEQQLFTTRRDLSAARYQSLLALLQLKAAVGQLQVSDLHSLDALLKE